MSKLLKISLSKCYDPPHDWVDKEPGWVRCTKCKLVTTTELLSYYNGAFNESH